MRFDNCPMCGGKKTVFQVIGIDGQGRERWNDGPCPTCQDSDGEPTGRIAVMSDEEVEAIRIAFDSAMRQHQSAARCESAIQTELTHRKEGGGNAEA